MFLRWFDPSIRSGTIRIPPLLERELWFVHSHKRLGHLRRPLTFAEKFNWRILYDRRPLLAWTCDKLRMKEEAGRCGVASARVYWSGRDLRELVNVRLPDAWVLKPNHRTDLLHVGRGPVLDREIPELENMTRGWLDETQARLYGEWAYSQARPCLLVEEMLGDQQSFPPDYKIYVFDGEPFMLSVTKNRQHVLAMRFYTPDWEPMECSWGHALGPLESPPKSLDQMLDVAFRLGRPFDFMRIDLYNVGDTVYLGEFTPYPGGGMRPFQPHAVKRAMGAAWRLPARQAAPNVDHWIERSLPFPPASSPRPAPFVYPLFDRTPFTERSSTPCTPMANICLRG